MGNREIELKLKREWKEGEDQVNRIEGGSKSLGCPERCRAPKKKLSRSQRCRRHVVPLAATWKVRKISACPGRSCGHRERRRAGRGSRESSGALSFLSLSLSASQGTREGEALSVLLAKSTQLPGWKQGRGR
jgi:hypothetical protein